MTTATKAPDLPPFIVVGEWVDEQHKALSGRLTVGLTAGELATVIAGPRRHPYGPDAKQVITDGKIVIYPGGSDA
jgi:hypothetical protein